MVGFYLGDPVDSRSLQEAGLDVVPSATGEVLGAVAAGAIENMPTNRLADVEMRGMRDTGYSFAAGVPVRIGEPASLLAPEDANKEFKLPGMVPFSAPVSRETAQDIYDAHQRRLARENAIERRAGGIATGMVARFGTEMLTGLLDPLNVASAFIPVVPEAKIAAALAGASGAFGRAGVRAGVGAVEGAAGALALEPLNYALDRANQNDWTMGNAAMNVALGAAMGGVLHPVVGRFGAEERALRARDSVQAIVERMPPEVREMSMRGSLADVVEGRAVNVAPVADAARLGAVADEVVARAARVEAMAADAPRVAEVRTIADELRPIRGTREGAPVSLLEFIGQKGGILDQGGDLKAIGADVHFVPGQGRIVRKSGVEMDYIREAAEEAGYLRPGSTVADLIDAIAEEVARRRVYLPHEAVAANERRLARMSDREQEIAANYKAEVSRLAEDYGVGLKPAELDHAVMLTMDGMHPDEAIRAATVGTDLRATGFIDDVRAEMDAARELARKGAMDVDMRLAEAARAIDELRQSAGDPDGVLAKQMADVQKMQAELDAIVDAERAAGRFSPEQERMMAEFADEMKRADGDAKAMEAAGFCAAVRG